MVTSNTATVMNSTTKFTLCLVLLLPFSNNKAQSPLPPGHYDSADTSSPAALRESLHEIIDDHQRFPYTSHETDTWDVLEQADADRDEDGHIVTIYRNASFPRQGGGNDFYNREHTWPKSYGYPDDVYEDPHDNVPYTDMHALFLSDSDYNYHRSNSPYRSCDDDCNEYPSEANDGRGGMGGEDSNWQSGEFTDGRWEVWKGRRGDIARAQMYMDLRYEGGNHGVTGVAEPDLVLTNDLELIRGSYSFDNLPVAYMGMLSTLLEWHREDPVDAAEVQHHETVASYQGNRNPFIDHPEWAACIFEGNCEDMNINAGISDAWFSPRTSGQGFFITVWEQSRYMFVSWFTFDTERPPEDTQSILGEPGHRWLTAQGPYSGDSAELNLYLSAGGVFDAPAPAADPAVLQGTLKLHFENCERGTATYDIPVSGVSGVIPIERIVSDNVPMCESLNGSVDP
jgi:endonuclease I